MTEHVVVTTTEPAVSQRHPHARQVSAGTAAAALLSFVVWASTSTGGLLEAGPVTVRPIDVALLGLLGALLVLARRRVAAELAASRAVLVTGGAFITVVLASSLWVALDAPGARSIVLPSAVRMVQLTVVAAAAAYLARTWSGKTLLLRWLLYGALVVSVPYAIASLGWTAPLELLDLNPGKSAVGPVAVASLVLGLLVREVPLGYRLGLGGLSAVNLLFAVSMTAYLTAIVVLPVLVWVLLRLRKVPLVIQAAAVTGVAFLLTSYAYVGLQVLRPDALPSRIDTPLTIEPLTPAAPGDSTSAGSGGGLAGATVLHRAILMSTAFEVFETSPLTGVGWTRGDDRGVVDDPEIVGEMKRRFPSGYDTLFTDVSPLGAHNAFLQVLAELGLLGGLAVLGLIIATAIAATATTRASGCSPGQVRTAATGLGLLAVALGFLMFTGLYPGQVETLLAAVAIGTAGTVPRATRGR